MDKDKVVEKLKGKGYNVSNADGVIMFRVSVGEYPEITSKIRAALKEIDYNASWGVTTKKIKGEQDALNEQDGEPSEG